MSPSHRILPFLRPHGAVAVLGLLILTGSLLAIPSRMEAQLIPGLPVTVEARPILTLPVGEFSETGPGPGAEVGFGVAVTTRLQVTSRYSVYGGIHYARFGCGECAEVSLQDRMPEAGFEAGLQASLPFRPAGIVPWIRAGGLINRELQISGAEGDLVSDPGLGWSAGIGARVPLGPSFRLTPGVHYRTYPAEFSLSGLSFDVGEEAGTFVRDLDVASLSLEVGLSYEF